MSNYKDIIGTHIKSVTTDPPNPENGQMWYNSTTRVVKGFTSNPAGAWSSGNSMNTVRSEFKGGGTQTSAIVFAGQAPPSGFQVLAESYNGTTFSEVNDLNTGRLNIGGAGVSSSQAIAFGGATTPNSENETETWNGTSWTEQSELGTASRYMGNTSNGSGANAICFGGSSSGPSQNETTTQEWTASATLSTVTSS